MSDVDAAVEMVAQAIWGADDLGPYVWDMTPATKARYLRKAQCALAALQLAPEKERRKKCVCRHPEVDHDMYGTGKCGANMVTRHTPCPCTKWEPQDRIRLVTPWTVTT